MGTALLLGIVQGLGSSLVDAVFGDGEDKPAASATPDSSGGVSSSSAAPATKSASPPAASPTSSPPGAGLEPLYQQQGVRLSADSVLDFEDRPMRSTPKQNALTSPWELIHDLNSGSTLSARGQVAILRPGQSRTFETCSSEDRYFLGEYMRSTQIPVGSAFCVTSEDRGLITLVQVKSWTQNETSNYVTLDITQWAGTPPT
ncbi:hypothetical protein ACFC5X_29190 [Streptomyces sp. NPDC055952]|uniref:hypothetical protein n=1 Tax=Streptomyces sp. NPDC055952 TaxID=3345663 RepID=UPI0035D98359